MDNLRGFNNTDNSDSYNNLWPFDRLRAKARMTEAEADLVKAEALATLASKPAQKMNPLIFIIPVAGLLTLGIIFIVATRRKKT